MRVTVRGKRWDLVFSSKGLDKDQDGFCDAPTKTGKSIRVRPNLESERELDILIHELTHAGLWDLDEEVVTEFATDLARTLHRLGYRRNPKES